jgi:hypothetical protein
VTTRWPATAPDPNRVIGDLEQISIGRRVAVGPQLDGLGAQPLAQAGHLVGPPQVRAVDPAGESPGGVGLEARAEHRVEPEAGTERVQVQLGRGGHHDERTTSVAMPCHLAHGPRAQPGRRDALGEHVGVPAQRRHLAAREDTRNDKGLQPIAVDSSPHEAAHDRASDVGAARHEGEVGEERVAPGEGAVDIEGGDSADHGGRSVGGGESPAAHGFHVAVACTALTLAVPDTSPERIDDAARFVSEQIAAMPYHLRAGVEAGGLVLGLHALARTGRRFSALPARDRERLVRAWLASRLAPVAQYVRVLRALARYAAQEPVR